MADFENTTPLRTPPEVPADQLRTLVEVDHRRGSIGLHIASDVTRAARTSTSLWLAPDRAQELAVAILAAVEAWREHQQTIAWTVTRRPTGGAHG
jgi:hypothetical protein